MDGVGGFGGVRIRDADADLGEALALGEGERQELRALLCLIPDWCESRN